MRIDKFIEYINEDIDEKVDINKVRESIETYVQDFEDLNLQVNVKLYFANVNNHTTDMPRYAKYLKLSIAIIGIEDKPIDLLTQYFESLSVFCNRISDFRMDRLQFAQNAFLITWNIENIKNFDKIITIYNMAIKSNNVSQVSFNENMIITISFYSKRTLNFFLNKFQTLYPDIELIRRTEGMLVFGFR